MAPWARKELRRRQWATWRTELFAQVRLVFVLLFGVTIYVYVSDNHQRLEAATSAGIHRIANHETLSVNLRQHALNYEKQIDAISQ